MANLNSEIADVCPEVSEHWKRQLLAICEGYPQENFNNGEKTGIFFYVVPSKS